VSTGRNTTTRDLHRRILKRRKQDCAICGEPIDYSLPYLHPMEFVADHIIPVAKGGADVIENKQACHRRCNRDKSDAIDYDPRASSVTPASSSSPSTRTQAGTTCGYSAHDPPRLPGLAPPLATVRLRHQGLHSLPPHRSHHPGCCPMIPRYAEPMCGWPHGVDLCDHGLPPGAECDWCAAEQADNA
jgi:hypothetical protein